MNKTEIVRAKVTPIERKALLLIAEQEGIKMSEAIRQIIRKVARERDVWSRAVEAIGRTGCYESGCGDGDRM